MRTVSVFFAFLLLFPAGCAILSPGEMEKCLPETISMHTCFSPEEVPRKPTTIRRTLIQMGAHCKNGKIFDRWGKEIYFYQIHESGGVCQVTNLEAPKDESHEEEDRLKSLEKKYRVIKMYAPDPPCNPLLKNEQLAN